MQITHMDIRIHEDHQLRGFVKIVLDDCLAICGIKIIEGKNGLFLAMPSRMRHNGKHSDFVFPIVPWLRNYLENEVLDHYWRMKSEELERSSEENPPALRSGNSR